MRNKALVISISAGVLTSVAAFLLGTQFPFSAQEPSSPTIRSTPNALCFRDTAPDQFSAKHIETKLIACQVVGMTKQAAINFIERKDLVVRIAMEDDEYFPLTEDYTDSRINLEIVFGLVVGATAW